MTDFLYRTLLSSFLFSHRHPLFTSLNFCVTNNFETIAMVNTNCQWISERMNPWLHRVLALSHPVHFRCLGTALAAGTGPSAADTKGHGTWWYLLPWELSEPGGVTEKAGVKNWGMGQETFPLEGHQPCSLTSACALLPLCQQPATACCASTLLLVEKSGGSLLVPYLTESCAGSRSLKELSGGGKLPKASTKGHSVVSSGEGSCQSL